MWTVASDQGVTWRSSLQSRVIISCRQYEGYEGTKVLAAMLCSIEWKISVVFSNQEADLEIVKILVNSHRPDNESLLPVYPLLISAPFSASRSSFWSPGWWRQPEVSSYPGPPLPSSSILLTTALNIPSLSSWSWVPLYSVYSYSFLLLS